MVGSGISLAVDPLAIGSMQGVFSVAMELVQATSGAAMLIDAQTDVLDRVACCGPPDADQSMARWVIGHGQPLVLEAEGQTPDDPGFVSSGSTLAAVCVPIRSQGEVVGAL